MQAALPMGNNKITGMATPTIATDAVTKAYADALGPTSFIVTGTGSADVITGVFTPTIAALTNGLTVEVRATAANATTTPTFQADATAAKTIVKGAGAALIAGNIPGAGFWMSLTYDSVLDKWVLNNPTIIQPASPVPGSFKNLSIKVATNTTISVVADFVVMTDGTNFATMAPSGAVLNMATTGTNGLDTGAIAAASWYSIWAIWNGAPGSQANLASLSATAPTMPSGYTYKVRLGWVRTAPALAQLLGTWQLGRQAQYVVGLAQTSISPLITSGAAGTYSSTAPVWSTVAIGNFFPSTASKATFTANTSYNVGAVANVLLAPNGSYAGFQGTNVAPLNLLGATNSNPGTAQITMLLESTNVSWVSGAAGGALIAFGWEDNI